MDDKPTMLDAFGPNAAAGVIQYLSMRLDFVRDIDHEVIRQVANYVVKGDWTMADAEEFLRQVQAQDVRLKSGNPPRNAVPSLNRTATQMLQQQEAATERMKTIFNGTMGPGYWESCEDQRRARLAALDTFGIPPERVPPDGANRATAAIAEAAAEESAAEQMTKLWKEIMEEDLLLLLQIPSTLRTAEQQTEIHEIQAGILQRHDEENRYRMELLKDMSFIVPGETVDELRARKSSPSSPRLVQPEPETSFLTGKRKIVLE